MLVVMIEGKKKKKLFFKIVKKQTKMVRFIKINFNKIKPKKYLNKLYGSFNKQKTLLTMCFYSFLTFLGPIITRTFLNDHPDQCPASFCGFYNGVFLWMKYVDITQNNFRAFLPDLELIKANIKRIKNKNKIQLLILIL